MLGDHTVRQAIAVTLRTNAIANASIVLVGTPAAYLLATSGDTKAILDNFARHVERRGA